MQASYTCATEGCARPVVRTGSRGLPPARCPECASEHKRERARINAARYRQNRPEEARGHVRRFHAGYRRSGRLRAVGLRCGWTCVVCGEAVDPAVPNGDGRAPVLKWREFPTQVSHIATDDDFVLAHDQCKGKALPSAGPQSCPMV